MQYAKIVDSILKQADKFLSKKQFEDKNSFLDALRSTVNNFNSKLVKLKNISNTFEEKDGKQFWQCKIQIIFDLNDPYINSKAYQSGSVFIFPSEKLYKELDNFCMKIFGSFPQWDESKTIATITGNAKAKNE